MIGAYDLDLDLETDEAWEDLEAALLTVDEEGEKKRWRREQAELRQLLGVDDAFGYRFVDNADDADDAPGYPTLSVARGVLAGASGPPVRAKLGAVAVALFAREPGEPGEPVGPVGPVGPGDGRASAARFPCMEGVRYNGCLGMACALDTCWTGGATVSFAHRMREQAHVSTALYLPGAPCHGCARLHEDTAPVRAPRPPATTPPDADEGKRARARDVGGDSRGDAAGGRANGGGDGDERGGEARAAGRATLRRISCTRGLWAHPISLSSFVTGRIPMRDEDDPRRCPGFEPRPAPHPAVAAHLERRRERAKRQREERRDGDG